MNFNIFIFKYYIVIINIFSLATLQAAANIEYRMKTDQKDLVAAEKKRKDEEFVMSECNHGNAITFEKRTTGPYFKKAPANQMEIPAVTVTEDNSQTELLLED